MTPRRVGRRTATYAMLLGKGLRCGELPQITWQDIDLGDRPVMHVRVKMSKARRHDAIPLHRVLVKLPADRRGLDRPFATVPQRRTFLRDVERTRIRARDDDGRTMDRHALRTTFCTMLAEAGIDTRMAMQLARHAPSNLTERGTRTFGCWTLKRNQKTPCDPVAGCTAAA